MVLRACLDNGGKAMFGHLRGALSCFCRHPLYTLKIRGEIDDLTIVDRTLQESLTVVQNKKISQNNAGLHAILQMPPEPLFSPHSL